MRFVTHRHPTGTQCQDVVSLRTASIKARSFAHQNPFAQPLCLLLFLDVFIPGLMYHTILGEVTAKTAALPHHALHM